jgi:hypothetical protein
MDATIFGQTGLSWEWYNWAVYLAFAITLAVALWILYDSQRKLNQAMLWRIVTVVSAIFVIPSLVLAIDGRFSALPLALKMLRAVEFLPYLGILGGLGALLALIGYVGGWGVEEYEEPLPPLPPQPFLPPQPAPGLGPLPTPPMGPTEQVAPPGFGIQEVPGPGPAPVSAQTMQLQKELAQMAWFIVRSGPRSGKEFRLGEITNIGRNAVQNDIAIDDSAISSQHARVKLEDGRFVLYDLASTNHTYVNGDEIQKHVLVDADRIKMGETDFVFIEVKEKDEDQED